MNRAQRRHHRARRLAAVTRHARALGQPEDDHNPHFLRILARTRVLCSCWGCKHTREHLAKIRKVDSDRDFQAAVATAERDIGDAECDAGELLYREIEGLDSWADETRAMLAEWDVTKPAPPIVKLADIMGVLRAYAPKVKEAGGAYAPFGAAG